MKEKTLIRIRVGWVALATMVVVGCTSTCGTPTAMARTRGCSEEPAPRSQGGSEDAWEEIRTNSVPIRVGVYVDAGTGGLESFRLLQFASTPEEAEVRCVDGEQVRTNALETIDLLMVSGADGAAVAKSLGPEGCAKVKSFIARGGSFIGVGAGCALALQGGSGMALVPFKAAPVGERQGQAGSKIKFDPEGKTMGIAVESRELPGANVPVMVPADAVADSEVKILARLDGDSAKDKAVMVAGRYGKGRVFLSDVHLEARVADWDILKSVFAWSARTWATRKQPEYRSYPHERGNLQVGVVSAGAYGVETGDILLKVARLSGVDMMPVDADCVRRGILLKLDAVMFGATGSGDMLKQEDVRAKLAEFIKAGELAVAWGAGADGLDGVEKMPNSDAAVERLYACKLSTVAQPPSESDGSKQTTGKSVQPKHPWHLPERPEIAYRTGIATDEGKQLGEALAKEPELNLHDEVVACTDVLVLSNPKTEDITAFARLLASQDRLVVLASDSKSAVPADLKGAVICKTAAETVEALRKCLEKFDDWKPENEDEKEKKEDKK